MTYRVSQPLFESTDSPHIILIDLLVCLLVNCSTFVLNKKTYV